jgi:crotonobetainyl-CoA:carnitine CoA-transferase CaiB-like acyl-CoA transferase
MLGEHTAQVCSEVLGMDDEEMAQLVMESVLF